MTSKSLEVQVAHSKAPKNLIRISQIPYEVN